MKRAPEKEYRFLAARYIRRQIKELAEQIEDVRKAEGIEPVHRSRVASRRLRAALAVFSDCFSSHSLEYWRKEVRRLGRELGAARDKDVQLEYVSGALGRASDAALTPGIARVLVKWDRKRESLQPKVLQAFRRLLAGRALQEMLAATKAMLPKSSGNIISMGQQEKESPESTAGESRGQTVQGPLQAKAQGHLLGQLDELLTFEACLSNPDDYKRHHAMRIAAKRLRYTMEIWKPVFSDRFGETLKALKQVQSLLGDVHDCDVWVGELDKLLAKESRRITAKYGHPSPLARLRLGIEHLKNERREYRREVFEALVNYWQELGRQGVWEELRSMVLPPAASSAGDPSTSGAANAAG